MQIYTKALKQNGSVGSEIVSAVSAELMNLPGRTRPSNSSMSFSMRTYKHITDNAFGFNVRSPGTRVERLVKSGQGWLRAAK